jgi:hypothetical protein
MVNGRIAQISRRVCIACFKQPYLVLLRACHRYYFARGAAEFADALNHKELEEHKGVSTRNAPFLRDLCGGILSLRVLHASACKYFCTAGGGNAGGTLAVPGKLRYLSIVAIICGV